MEELLETTDRQSAIITIKWAIHHSYTHKLKATAIVARYFYYLKHNGLFIHMLSCRSYINITTIIVVIFECKIFKSWVSEILKTILSKRKQGYSQLQCHCYSVISKTFSKCPTVFKIFANIVIQKLLHIKYLCKSEDCMHDAYHLTVQLLNVR